MGKSLFRFYGDMQLGADLIVGGAIAGSFAAGLIWILRAEARATLIIKANLDAVGVFRWDDWRQDFKIILSNRAADASVGTSLQGQWLKEVLPANYKRDEKGQIPAEHYKRVALGRSPDFEEEFRYAGDNLVGESWWLRRCQRFGYKKCLITWREVTAQKQLEKKLLEDIDSLAAYKQALERSPIGWAFVSFDGRFIWVNEALCKLLGYSADHCSSLSFQEVTHSDDLEKDLTLFNDFISQQWPFYKIEKRYIRSDGSLVWVEVTVTRVEIGGQLRHLIGQITDISDRRQIKQLAITDSLTQLFNRRYFEQQLEALLQRSQGSKEPLALLFLDLNKFKLVNDTYGHQTGDRVLQAVAERIKACIRPGDIAARIGGDEFVILSAGASAKTAYSIGDRIGRAICKPFEFEGQSITIGVSIGGAIAS